ncbi:PREDICTED: olfactory receptor 52K1-like [Chrysochloris asiatica]|uniref:Olfactory receptor n=1 Tax=Chrysochloris asiatica TaxID=185453 RepID=A0A9B0WUC2_CHRAS|nr:PREDICTED: olfactory receptor 52K1-like [Chrysochloris asiatica]
MQNRTRHLTLKMLVQNRTYFHPTTFLLLGIPGLEMAHIWISIPFCLVYIIALMGNCILVFIIKTEPSLHEPMYLFLCMLSVNDLMLSTTTLPKILTLFWFDDRKINFKACLTQIFFIHSLSTMESGFLLVMAFDRYVAICNPLRHSTILTPAMILTLILTIVLRGVILLTPHPFLLLRLTYCKTHVIAHTYCEFMALIKLACENTRIYRIYGLILAFLTGGVDFILIIWSYIFILYAVFQLPSKKARLKALSTCGAHVWVILVFYIPAFFSFITHRFAHHIAPCIHIFIANIYLLIPPMLNPIIYGVKTKNIRERFLKIFTNTND